MQGRERGREGKCFFVNLGKLRWGQNRSAGPRPGLCRAASCVGRFPNFSSGRSPAARISSQRPRRVRFCLKVQHEEGEVGRGGGAASSGFWGTPLPVPCLGRPWFGEAEVRAHGGQILVVRVDYFPKTFVNSVTNLLILVCPSAVQLKERVYEGAVVFL